MNAKNIKDLADLAHLQISEEEAISLGKDFSSILSYVGQLSEVDTEDMQKDPSLVENQMREDLVTNNSNSDDLLSQAPQRKDRYIKVQKIINVNNE